MLPTVAAAPNTTVCVTLLLSDVFNNAPAPDIPEPLIVIDSATSVNPPDTDSVAPSATVVAPSVVPNAVL